MQTITIKIRVLVVIIQIFIVLAIGFHAWVTTYLLKSSNSFYTVQPASKSINETLMAYSRRAPIIYNCSHKSRVAFTFDDGPHPIYTSVIVQALNRQQVKAGFFLLGTSIQSFLGANNELRVNQFERPRLGYLLLQDYSSIERLLERHDIYLHGWLHEKNSEMRLQTVVDNIATQLIEIGLLKNFKPLYRAPWGIGTLPRQAKNKVLISRILTHMGIIPASWDIDTYDYPMHVNEHNIINNTLGKICNKKGGIMLMHDNRPSTAYILDRLIRSIRASGHTIVSPGEIDRTWNDRNQIDRTRKYIEFLRNRTRAIQNNRTAKIDVYRPVEISFPTGKSQGNILPCIEPTARYEGPIKVSPNISEVKKH